MSRGTCVCWDKEGQNGDNKIKIKRTFKIANVAACETHPYDDADGRYPGGGHHFGTVGDEVEQDGHDSFCSMVKFIPKYCWYVTTGIQKQVKKNIIILALEFVLVSSLSEIRVIHSRHSDASLTDNLWAEVFRW